MGLEWPSGIGVGEVCRCASFWAREFPDPFLDEEELGERSRKSVARNEPAPLERWPVACALGQRLGTAEWIAFRDAFSPVVS